MLASDVTKTVTLPSDPSVTVTIAKLGWLQRQAAAKESQRQAARLIVDMGGTNLLKEMLNEREAETAEPGGRQALRANDPYLTHDPLMVLVGGVKRWTSQKPITKDTLAELDEADAEFLAREILALTIRQRSEAEEKNAASGSTGT